MKKVLLGAAVLAASVVWSSAAVSASDQGPLRCLAGMRAALIRGRFSGVIVCSKKNATFTLVGRTTGDKFSIYDYRYRFLPAGGDVMHGGQRVVVFRGSTYVGQYTMSPPPYVIVTMNGTHVVLQPTDTREKVELDFSVQPPGEILVNGEIETFYR